MTADPMEVLLGLVLEDGRYWGGVASPQQRSDAAAVLDVAGPRRHFVTRPRGGSKTTDEAGVALAVLLDQAPPGSRSYVVAVDADQGGLLHTALAGFVRRSGLADDLQVMAQQIVNRKTGAALEVLPADSASAWGLTPYLVIVDELAQWPTTRNHRTLWEAVVSSMQKVPDSRLVCLTSAGDPAHWSAKVIEGARKSVAWRVSEMPGPVPWHSEAELAELAWQLTPSSYARLVLNEWTAPEDRLTTVDDLRMCVQHEGVLPPVKGVRYAISLDLGKTNDATVVAVGHRKEFDDGSVGVTLDRMDVWQGRKGAPVDLVDVAEHIAELSRQYNGAELVFDPYEALHLTQVLRRRGVRSVPFAFSATSVGRIALVLFRLLRDGMLDLPDDEALLDELAHVRLRENSVGVMRIDHDSGRHDDRAVALALLAHQLLEARRSRRRSIVNTSTTDPAVLSTPRHEVPWSSMVKTSRAAIERMIGP